MSVYSNKQNKYEITISIAQQPAFALIYIADKKGYFSDQGLVVNFNKHVLGRDALNDVLSGVSDLATVYDIPVVNAINEGQNLAILTTLHFSDKNHTLASFKKYGINNPADLRGKRIAMTKGVSTEFYLYTLLIEAGLNQNDVEIVSIEPEDLIPSLEKNIVDAVVLFNPYYYNFQYKYPQESTTFMFTSLYKEMSVLAGKKDYIENNSEIIIKTLSALKNAEQFIKTNKEESKIIVDLWLENYDHEGVEKTWDIFDYSLTLNNQLLLLMERESDFFYESGVYSKGTPNLRNYFLTDYLTIIKPEGVTLY